jgi:hypothetical protein
MPKSRKEADITFATRYLSGRNVAETGPNHPSTHTWLNPAKNAKLELRARKKLKVTNEGGEGIIQE